MIVHAKSTESYPENQNNHKVLPFYVRQEA